MTPEQTALAAAERLEQELLERAKSRKLLSALADCDDPPRGGDEYATDAALDQRAADTLAVLRAALGQAQLADELDVLCECGGTMVAAIAGPHEVLWICERETCHQSVNTTRKVAALRSHASETKE